MSQTRTPSRTRGDATLEAVADDTEYVDDPQIDLLSA